MTAGTIRRQQELGEPGRREPLKPLSPGPDRDADAIGTALIDETFALVPRLRSS